MYQSIVFFCALTVGFTFAGCDNRTAEAARWEQIALDQQAGNHDQPWEQAKSPWSNSHHHTGKAW